MKGSVVMGYRLRTEEDTGYRLQAIGYRLRARNSGVLEIELAEGPPWQSRVAARLWSGAEASLRRLGGKRPDWDDIASEALEAGEALYP